MSDSFIPKTYTVESVAMGHPDKVCDQISDAILDACLAQDPQSRVAVETFGSHGVLTIGGEITTRAKVDYAAVAREVYKNIGYTDTLDIKVHIAEQSPDIAAGVDLGGAGDQGMMYGYATNETPEFLPKGVVLVHALMKKLAQVRQEPAFNWLGPDGKAQVTLKDGVVDTVLVSVQHNADQNHDAVVAAVRGQIINALPEFKNAKNILVNPAGLFCRGGVAADTGLTGRKIMVDTYGGLIPHGGGCFSGKDPTKVDRSAAYMARFAAKNLVATGHAKECLASVAYAIGVAEPLMLTARDEQGGDLTEVLKKLFDFRPKAIMERLNLRQPIYQQTATFGHFGNPEYHWEQIISS